MKKKVTNEEIGEIIGKIADNLRNEMDYDFRVAKSQMQIAENDLVATLNEEQLVLYNDYRKKRDEFYAVASEMYQKKY